jgi:uncharacterized protein (TIGR00288 family)
VHNASEHALAVLVDIENMARPGARNRGEFDIHLVMSRLAEKGRVVVKRAYADWSRYRDARRELMNAGLELIEMPSAREGAKNRADIKMAVDAMEIAYSRQHVDNFVIVSGDSDFTPLVGKLRELNKRVIGVGRDESSASPLLIANCDEFIFYDSLASKALPHHGGVRPDALTLLRETLMARQREGDEHPQASAVKDSMRRRDPAFDEGEIGFSTFSKFLEDAQVKGVVRLEKDPRSGTYLVDLGEGGAGPGDWPTLAPERPIVELGEGRRRRRRRRGEPAEVSAQAEGNGDEAAIGDGAEVFEFEVRPKEVAAAELPPLDQPITYEDVVLAADDLEGELPELVEATDVTEEGPPSRGSRRRRRSLASLPEPTSDDLTAETGEAEAASAEAAEAPAVEAAIEETPAEEPATGRRRRVRRGSVLPALAPVEPAGEPTAAEAAPAEEEAPKPKRRTRKKATEEEAPAEPVAAAEASPAEEEAPKPKRRTRKKATEEETPAEPVAAAEATPAEEEAPKPKRRTRKKATEEEAPAEPVAAE